MFGYCDFINWHFISQLDMLALKEGSHRKIFHRGCDYVAFCGFKQFYLNEIFLKVISKLV